uniref:CSON000931 protein n=2 Tax=Culicoides sonorensis TaxID=179676 RepID=A0A336KZB0_CULSO
MCWDQCTQNTKINTNLNAWPLRTVSMVRNESLVTADVAWQLLNTPCQYLVTWEISGGGLKGNLITETPSVQLSLWPDTVYRVQVTCRNKETEVVTHSLPLTLDTSHAVILTLHKPSTTFAINTKDKDMENMSINNEDDIQQQLAEEDFRRQQQLQLQQRHYPHHYTFNSKSLGIWTIYENRQEIVLGVFIAILVFFIVLSIVYLVKRRKSRYVNDKEGLIENEIHSSSTESNQSTPVHSPQILHF